MPKTKNLPGNTEILLQQGNLPQETQEFVLSCTDRAMRQNTLNFWIDLVTLAVFIALILTGLLIYYILPPCQSCQSGGCDKTAELTLWGWGRHDFGRVHLYLALAMLTLITIHLFMHWSWLCLTVCSLLGWKTPNKEKLDLYGVIALIAVVIGILGILYFCKTQVAAGPVNTP